MNISPNTKALFFIYTGRLLITLALLALFGAWITQVKSSSILGMNQQHLFNDAIVLSLLGIGFLLDGVIHSKNL